jgi:hypothetical protein
VPGAAEGDLNPVISWLLLLLLLLLLPADTWLATLQPDLSRPAVCPLSLKRAYA